jgi:hypothetical protein
MRLAMLERWTEAGNENFFPILQWIRDGISFKKVSIPEQDCDPEPAAASISIP